MCTDGKPHDTISYPETLGDGSQRPVVKCTKCGTEWR